MFILNNTNSIGNKSLAGLRDCDVQQDRARFRKNAERLGEILAYEISKSFEYSGHEVQTPLGTANIHLPEGELVLGTILRAGLPFHQGFLNYFEDACSLFATAYRKVKKSGAFVINVDHISTPDLDGKILLMCDTMLATGQSLVQVCTQLLAQYKIKELHIAAIIASTEGIAHVRAKLPGAKLWLCAVDGELTSKAYIVPGLGDAGDLAFGMKAH